MTGDSETRERWTEPGPHLVAPGVHRIPLPLPQDGLRAANVYLVSSPGGAVLVDSGWAITEARVELERALAAVEVDLRDVTDFLVTHAHRDHYTMATTVRRELGTRVSLGAGERATLDALASAAADDDMPQIAFLRRAGARDLAQSLTGRGRQFDRAEWAAPDRYLDDGQQVAAGDRTLRVVHTPGHTRGHVVYSDDAAGLLFAGDHVLPHITPSIAFEQVPSDRPLAQFLSSLTLLKDSPDAVLLPGHGPVTASVHQRVDQLLEHHARRLDASAAALTGGATTAHDVAGRLVWTRREHRLADLDPLNQMLAVLETASHLDLLVERGILRGHRDPEGIDRYAV